MEAVKKSLRKHWVAYLMLLPAVVLLFIFSYIPMYGIIIAFKDYKPMDGIFGSEWVGLQHFKDFFTNPYFLVLLRNTLILQIYGMVVGYPLPVILALVLNEVRNLPFKKTVQTISYMPYFISGVVVAGMVKSFFAHDGMVNGLMEIFGAEPHSFLSDPQAFRHILVWTGQWQSVGWNSIIYMSALAAIDQELYEAARIDGCGRLRQAWHITVPGILPTFIILLILGIGGLFSSDGGLTLLLYGPLVYESSDVFATYTYRLGIRGGKFAYTTAVGLAQTAVGFLMVVFTNWLSRKTTEQSLW